MVIFIHLLMALALTLALFGLAASAYRVFLPEFVPEYFTRYAWAASLVVLLLTLLIKGFVENNI